MLSDAFVFETRHAFGGASPRFVRLGVSTFGTLSAARDNAVLVCHYLTGTSRAAGLGGWWDEVIGPGRAIDTDRFFVVCMNSLSNVQARDRNVVTTGTDEVGPWTFEDLWALQLALLRDLGAARWHAVIGPSFGGMQALQWAARAPDLAPRVAAIAASPRAGIVLRGAFAPLLRSVAARGSVEEALRLVSLFGFGADGLFQTFGAPDADFEDYLRERGACASLAHLIDLVGVIETHDVEVIAPMPELARSWGNQGVCLLTVNVRGDLFFPAEEARGFAETTRAAGASHVHLEVDSRLGHLACVAEPHLFAEPLRALLST